MTPTFQGPAVAKPFLLLLVVGMAAGSGASRPAAGQVVTFNFSGVVTELDLNAGLFGPFGSVNVGDPFTGHFSYALGLGNPDQLPADPEVGRYNGLEFVVNGAAIVFDAPLIAVQHNFTATLPPAPPSSFDRFAVFSASPGSLYLSGIRLELRGPYGAALADDSLPAGLDLAAFTDSQSLAGVRFVGLFPNPSTDDVGRVGSLDQVPEPSVGPVIAGACALLFVKSRRRRNCRDSGGNFA
jgi:hypothetical protein